jgi:RHS repeat-associated protein
MIEDADGSGSGSAITTPYTANNLNQYTAIDSLAAPTYDANGNTATLQTSLTGPTWSYTYDAQDRLTGGTSTTGDTFTFAYDARNRCIARVINGTTIANLYDDWSLIEERTPVDSLSATHMHGAWLDEILCTIRDVSGSSVTTFHHHDGLGSVTALSDTTGTLLERYSYDAYGKPTIYNAAGAIIAVSAQSNRFLYTGREWFQELNLSDHRHRYYQPDIGRWLSRDPIEEYGGINLYGYVENRPTGTLDSFGLAGNGFPDIVIDGSVWRHSVSDAGHIHVGPGGKDQGPHYHGPNNQKYFPKTKMICNSDGDWFPAPNSFLKKWRQEVDRLKKLGKNVKGVAGLIVLISTAVASGQCDEKITEIQFKLEIYRAEPDDQIIMDIVTLSDQIFGNEAASLNLWKALQDGRGK